MNIIEREIQREQLGHAAAEGVKLKPLAYTVALTIEVPHGMRAKPHLPDGIRWKFWRWERQPDGWWKYTAGAVLDQDDMDYLVDATGMAVESVGTGGTIRPAGFPQSWVPAMKFLGDYGYPTFSAYVTPFPAGLRRPNSYRFGRWDHMVAQTTARYGRY